MSNVIALTIESLVAVLLAITIGYCWLLNRRLTKLRADESALKAMIAELVTATDIAERAIAGLKEVAGECDATLGERLARAEALSNRLGVQLEEGDAVVHRLKRIAGAARVPPVEPPSVPVVAPPSAANAPAPPVSVAQAFLARARERRAEAAA